MANLKEIRDRISSVKNTRKITEAMRLVAAAKVRRAQEQVLRARPFADRLARVLENLQSRLRFEDVVNTPLLEQERPLRNITLLAVSADRGLCGGYNANIIKRTEQRFAELKGQGYEISLVLIGRKATTYFQNRSYPITATFTGLDQVPNADEARSIADQVLAEFLSGSTDRVEMVYTKFINLVSSAPVSQTLLPLDPQGIASPDDEIFRLTTREGRLAVERATAPNQEPALESDFVFEQSPDQLLNALLPLYLENQLLRSLQESSASELASRMTAMNNASDNAKALAKSLTLDYNKARQAAITQEILEVVGGATAMA
ncbi:F0F1 ATP synthase subunit gamma [Synechococcus sp. Cruz-9H2]|uniref:F0F1 ATP synthase subunit gamma n=1 Tax=unclassified Synechococcus TaxID=2626047 RepID=UPI0020CCBD3C|nr:MULTISPECIES: F0F1 ATP synthase subunit gamma [unclassified Synechococcus]MCP9819101.1 F0F1 ATP synthase subunit gamma [Synechococcus sp. Cruz-9H2]MCP9843605.1 F0F1 ATP synthase subunit gamma [Synechococcus sp. Edmonson 11F2]MCP9855676.1 F0F1 ATP synthase subunit gamma [Synechococcus sp. Cruz-9C9]MCP9863114.1 F0F1 ATP synthase subunit gamma [Synechococcus sp. Cruz-7E5]MCP9870011.1 F0F1 ATP synthase subunit gamma [Synechococcus sp. Cruz-7B9]